MDNKIAEAYVEVGADLKPMQAAFTSIRSGLSKLVSARFSLPGGGLLAGLGLAGAGVGIGKAISGASDLAETMSKVAVTFGDSAKTVTGAADEMQENAATPLRNAEYLYISRRLPYNGDSALSMSWGADI